MREEGVEEGGQAGVGEVASHRQPLAQIDLESKPPSGTALSCSVYFHLLTPNLPPACAPGSGHWMDSPTPVVIVWSLDRWVSRIIVLPVRLKFYLLLFAKMHF